MDEQNEQLLSTEGQIESEMLVIDGGPVKSLGTEGRVGGYLVRFGGQDLEGDTFSPDTDFGPHVSMPVLYQHGMDKKLGLRSIGEGTIKKDDAGLWIEAQLDLNDDYTRYLYEKGIDAGRMGWSSGTASHLVKRERRDGKSVITHWPLGLDASITPTPAEPRNVAMTLKSVTAIEFVPEADSTPAEQVEADATKQTPIFFDQTQMTSQTSQGDDKMDETMIAEIKAAAAASANEAVEEAIKKAGIPAAKPTAPVVNMNPTANNLKAIFMKWVRTGDDGAANEVNAEMKTTYPWNEGTAAEGAVLVPTELYNGIFMKLHEKSFMRAAGAEIINVSSNKITLPTEGTAETAMVATDENGAYDENTTQPLGSISLAPHKFTRFMKISKELLRDALYPVESFLTSRILSAWALMENTQFVTGTGDGDPDIQGLVTGGTAGLTFDSASTIGAAELPELMWKLGAVYQDNAVLVMRGATLGLLAGLTGNPFYFQPAGANSSGMFSNRPSLMGKPVFLSDACAAIAASAKTIFYGDPFQYVIGQCGPLEIERNPYLLMANGQVGFYANVRIGGAVKQAAAWQYGTHPTA